MESRTGKLYKCTRYVGVWAIISEDFFGKTEEHYVDYNMLPRCPREEEKVKFSLDIFDDIVSVERI